MRRMMVRVPLFCAIFLSGGCDIQLCEMVGEFLGQFEGDLAGDVSAEVTVDPENDDQVIADMELTAADGTKLDGSSIVSCEDGALVLDLRNTELGDSIGEVTGTLADGEAEGAWSLFSGESGTWEY